MAAGDNVLHSTWHCPACGKPFRIPPGTKAPDVCPGCEKKHTIKRRVTREEAYHSVAGVAEPDDAHLEAWAAKVKLTTSHRFAGVEIEEELGIVAHEVIFGISLWKDLFAGVTDAFGGRSGKLEAEMRKLRESALAGLQREAARLEAHGVISVRLAYSEINSGRGMGMMLLVASGTAVTVRESVDD